MFNCSAKYRELFKQILPGSENTAQLEQVTRKNVKIKGLLKTYYELLPIVAPGLAHLHLTPDDPLDDPIILPSSYTVEEREAFGLQHLATIEIKLRIAQCYEALEKLRKALGVRSFLTRHGVKTNGLDQQTRAKASVKRAEHVVKQWAFVYRRSWERLGKLGASTESLGILQPLEESDLVMLSSWLEDEVYKHKDSRLPWIWTTALRSVPEEVSEEVYNSLIVMTSSLGISRTELRRSSAGSHPRTLVVVMSRFGAYGCVFHLPSDHAVTRLLPHAQHASPDCGACGTALGSPSLVYKYWQEEEVCSSSCLLYSPIVLVLSYPLLLLHRLPLSTAEPVTPTLRPIVTRDIRQDHTP